MGNIDTTVDARFDTGARGIFGLIGGSNLLNASNFALKESVLSEWASLSYDWTDARIAIIPSGGETMLDTRLSVPFSQPSGEYSETVILTFGFDV